MTPLPTAPLGSLIEATKDRLVISGVTASPSNVYYSQSGTPTNFTTGLNSADPYVDTIGAQGDQVRAMKFSLGRFFLWKTSSITSCILGDQYSSKCFPVSNSVGTSEPLSVVEIPGSILFRGSDGNYWSLDDKGINIISKKLSGLVASQNGGSTQRNIQTSQADWQAGTQYGPGTWNTVNAAGSVMNSSAVFVSSAGVQDWVMVDIDTTASPTNLFVSNNDGTAVDSIWTVRTGTITNSLHTLVGNTDNSGTTASASAAHSISTGVWSFAMQSTATTSGDVEYWIVANDTRTDSNNGGAYVLQIIQATSINLVKAKAGSSVSLVWGFTVPGVASGQNLNPFDGNLHEFVVTMATNGFS